MAIVSSASTASASRAAALSMSANTDGSGRKSRMVGARWRARSPRSTPRASSNWSTRSSPSSSPPSRRGRHGWPLTDARTMRRPSSLGGDQAGAQVRAPRRGPKLAIDMSGRSRRRRRRRLQSAECRTSGSRSFSVRSTLWIWLTGTIARRRPPPAAFDEQMTRPIERVTGPAPFEPADADRQRGPGDREQRCNGWRQREAPPR